MATLVKGIVGFGPNYFTSAKGTAVLKFVVHVDGQKLKKQPVVVFGKQAEKNADLAEGQQVVVSGELTENTFRDETTVELKLFGSKGNIKLVGENKIALKEDTEFGGGPNLADAPEHDFDGVGDTDWEEYYEYRACKECGHFPLVETPEEEDAQ